MFACITLALTKSQNHTMPPGIPDSNPFRPRFHPRFAHVLPTFSNGSFSVSGVYVGLVLTQFPELTALEMEFKDLRQFQAIFRTFGAQNFTIQVTLGAQQLEDVVAVSGRKCLNKSTLI